MSLPRYPEYKDSGVEWLGEVPGHWETWKVAHAFGSIGSGTTPPSSEEHWYDSVGTPWVTTGELRENIIFETSKSVTDAALEKFSALRIHPAGSLVVAMYGATIGRLGILGVDAVTNQACCVLSSPRHLDIAFTYYWLQGFKQIIIDLFSTGGGQPNINQDTVSSLRIPAPGLPEQTAIATFLDRETAKIDALVAEQEKLIALLQEKRQAVISHAVTKGLDPNVPMKDSGVEWLGEVPGHWEIKSIRHILEAIGDVDHFMPASVEKGVPYLMTGDLKEFASEVDFDGCKQVSDDDYIRLSKRIKNSRGDVIMARYATIGTSMYVDIDIDFLVSYSCVTLKTHYSKMPGLYLFKYMKSIAFLQGIENKINANTQGNVGIQDLQSTKIAVPPIHEQTAIATFLDRETSKLDTLTAEARSAITLLQERRTALISAAVTGQIDVRGLVGGANAPDSIAASAYPTSAGA